MNNEEEVDEIMQYRKEFMEFLRETNFIEIMTHEDIESALIVARGWLNNQKTYFQSSGRMGGISDNFRRDRYPRTETRENIYRSSVFQAA